MSQTVVVLGGGANVGRTTADLTRLTRGYARSRRDYDRRRRRFPLDELGKLYKQIVQADPCSTPGCDAPAGRDMAADHIVPLGLGGHNVWENLTALCRRCNASKKNESLLTWLAERRIA
jgi:5-methylcytosine-specific restriction endonuclease McrA